MTKQKLRFNVSALVYSDTDGRTDSIVDEAIDFATFHAMAFAKFCVDNCKCPNKYHWKQYAKNNSIVEVLKANYKP